MKVLLVEEDPKLAANIQMYLAAETYVCDCALGYREAIGKLRAYHYDCVILDPGIEGRDKHQVLEEITFLRKESLLVIISSDDAMDDKLMGLKLGADEYLSKPLHLSELSARLYSLMRRTKFSSNRNSLEAGVIIVDLLTRQIQVHGTPVILTRSEYDLLLFFIGSRKRVLSKAAMAEQLSGDVADMLSRHDFVYTHIKNLKAKLTRAGCPEYIKNVYGLGYRWET